MKNSALALTTAMSLLAFAPAYAEDMTGVDLACIVKDSNNVETIDKTKCPDGKSMTQAEQPADGDDTATTTTQQPEVDGQAAGSTTPPASADVNAAAQPDVLIVPADVLNAATVMSATDYIGKRVYDRGGNDIGEVNDIIISEDGRVQATIVGVGGFLGMGEKDVAVSVSAIEMVQDGATVRLVVDATKEQLESAPQFDSATRRYAG